MRASAYAINASLALQQTNPHMFAKRIQMSRLILIMYEGERTLDFWPTTTDLQSYTPKDIFMRILLMVGKCSALNIRHRTFSI